MFLKFLETFYAVWNGENDVLRRENQDYWRRILLAAKSIETLTAKISTLEDEVQTARKDVENENIKNTMLKIQEERLKEDNRTKNEEIQELEHQVFSLGEDKKNQRSEIIRLKDAVLKEKLKDYMDEFRKSRVYGVSSSDIHNRDRTLRRYYLFCTWRDKEFEIKREMAKIEFKLFPFLYEDEWDVEKGKSNTGKGDFVFTNGKEKFLVLETKWLDDNKGKTARCRRRKKKRQVKEQAVFYAKEWYYREESCSIAYAAYMTNVLSTPMLIGCIKDGEWNDWTETPLKIV